MVMTSRFRIYKRLMLEHALTLLGRAKPAYTKFGSWFTCNQREANGAAWNQSTLKICPWLSHPNARVCNELEETCFEWKKEERGQYCFVTPSKVTANFDVYPWPSRRDLQALSPAPTAQLDDAKLIYVAKSLLSPMMSNSLSLGRYLSM